MIAPIVELLAEVRRLGIQLVAEGERLRYSPRDRIPDELIGRLREFKPELIAMLTAEPMACPVCACPIFWLGASGATTCGTCTPKPADAIRKLLIVTLEDRNEWVDFDVDREEMLKARFDRMNARPERSNQAD